MQDRPSAAELIATVQTWLEREVLPLLDDQRRRFEGLIAANLLGIVERELRLGDELLLAEWQRLDRLFGSETLLPPGTALAEALAERNRALCARIAAGGFDAEPQRAALQAHLLQTAIDKLRIANPRLLARVLPQLPADSGGGADGG
ncbi:DUF6285 domain-containing protein [Kallotenue papyrolyticum]|uniref:DUF6285 domain-containing protein n=1 Tax=Kallotenue papyrolyticum TaxID=1325125 RepID=UPI0004925280|nr:DUF6285 domain-containing protein [Kallotenue papyrolyticum]